MFVVCNPCPSPPSLTILVPLWFDYLFGVFLVSFTGKVLYKAKITQKIAPAFL